MRGKNLVATLPHGVVHQRGITDEITVPGGWTVLLCCHETSPESQFGSNLIGKVGQIHTHAS